MVLGYYIVYKINKRIMPQQYHILKTNNYLKANKFDISIDTTNYFKFDPYFGSKYDMVVKFISNRDTIKEIRLTTNNNYSHHYIIEEITKIVNDRHTLLDAICLIKDIIIDTDCIDNLEFDLKIAV